MAMDGPVSELSNFCLGSQWKHLDNICRHQNIDDFPSAFFGNRAAAYDKGEQLRLNLTDIAQAIKMSDASHWGNALRWRLEH
jgi:hypothetical protein